MGQYNNMQTFLPEKNYLFALASLDTKRHGKQRLEAYDLIGLLTDFKITKHSFIKQSLLKRRYKNHPVLNLWRDNINALISYYNLSVLTWILKGYRNTMPIIYNPNISHKVFSDKLYSSHRANLLRKNYNFYKKYNWPENNINYKDIRYVWEG